MLVWSLLYRTSISVSRTPAVPFLFTIQHKVRFSPQSNHANYDAYKCRLFVSTLRLTSILTKEKRPWWQGDRWGTKRPETSYLGGRSRRKGKILYISCFFQQTSLNVVVTFWNLLSVSASGGKRCKQGCTCTALYSRGQTCNADRKKNDLM